MKFRIFKRKEKLEALETEMRNAAREQFEYERKKGKTGTADVLAQEKALIGIL